MCRVGPTALSEFGVRASLTVIAGERIATVTCIHDVWPLGVTSHDKSTCVVNLFGGVFAGWHQALQWLCSERVLKAEVSTLHVDRDILKCDSFCRMWNLIREDPKVITSTLHKCLCEPVASSKSTVT